MYYFRSNNFSDTYERDPLQSIRGAREQAQPSLNPSLQSRIGVTQDLCVVKPWERTAAPPPVRPGSEGARGRAIGRRLAGGSFADAGKHLLCFPAPGA